MTFLTDEQLRELNQRLGSAQSVAERFQNQFNAQLPTRCECGADVVPGLVCSGCRTPTGTPWLVLRAHEFGYACAFLTRQRSPWILFSIKDPPSFKTPLTHRGTP